MLAFGALAMFLGALLARGRDMVDFGNQIFGSFVAVTGDAHQARVAQDIFRQEIRYERSLQIREDIRDVNKMMLESVQTDLFIGSILLGVCFSMFVEGFPPLSANRTISDLWLVFVAWSATFQLLSLWLALCFQAKISSCTRERLLRKHRFQMPDEQLVGRMGGSDIVQRMALFHDRMLEVMQDVIVPAEDLEAARPSRKSRKRKAAGPLRVEVKSTEGRALQTHPMRKGMRAWLHKDGRSAKHTILDLPSFLVGETLVMSPWEVRGNRPMNLLVTGEATLYVAGQCPPRRARDKDQINAHVPSWPASQLPTVLTGFHDAWKNDQGFGEFRRVNGFSVFLDEHSLELPLYKMVLKTPDDNGDNTVNVIIQWNFHDGCEALLVMVRKGHVHCKEEDWPIQEFNNEIKQLIPFRDYSGIYMRYGVWCLLMGAFFTYLARSVDMNRNMWWFEVFLLFWALVPAAVAIRYIPIQMAGDRLTATISSASPELRWLATMNLERGFRSEEDTRTAGDLRASLDSQAPAFYRDSTVSRGADVDDTETPPARHLQSMGSTCPGLGACSTTFMKCSSCREVIRAGRSRSPPTRPPSPRSSVDSVNETNEWADEESVASVTSERSENGRAGSGAAAPVLQRARKSIFRVPSIITPITNNHVFGNQGSNTKALRSVMKKFQLWTNVLRTLFIISIIAAVASPYKWEELWNSASSWFSELSVRRLSLLEDCFEVGTRYSSPHHSGLRARTTAANISWCQARCAHDLGCTHFSFWPATLACHLQDETAAPCREPGVISGPPRCGDNGRSAIAEHGEQLSSKHRGGAEGAIAEEEDDEEAALESLRQLAWAEWEVEWPPLFRPTAAALSTFASQAALRGEVGEARGVDESRVPDDEILWLAAGATLRAMHLVDGARQDGEGSGGHRLRPLGPALVLPGEARALGASSAAANSAGASSGSQQPPQPRLALVTAGGGLFEVNASLRPMEPLRLVDGPALAASPWDVLAAAPVSLVAHPLRLPLGLAPTQSLGAAAVWHDTSSGTPAAAVATPMPSGDVSLCAAPSAPVSLATTEMAKGSESAAAAAAAAVAAAAAAAPSEMRVLGFVEVGLGSLVNATALHVCNLPGNAIPATAAVDHPMDGTGVTSAAAACGGAGEPVLWVARSVGHGNGLAAATVVTAVGLSSGLPLASFAGPTSVEAAPGKSAVASSAQVVALTGNASHIVAVTAAPGHRPSVFVAPYPALHAGAVAGVAGLEL